jgi:hypothetical protein
MVVVGGASDGSDSVVNSFIHIENPSYRILNLLTLCTYYLHIFIKLEIMFALLLVISLAHIFAKSFTTCTHFSLLQDR